MSKEVDTKVIQLQFENGDFEKGVKESRKSIGELDDSIKKLSDSANGSESIDKVSKVVVEKMNIMTSVVNTAVSRLTNNILDSAHKITHAFDDLTIAPVSKGFSKYEEQISSVQTIMNATGATIETVQKQLDKLMWYTDETSYSYSDMAANIGKFTSAGVELDDAVTAMMGIANWAGISGANVQQASRAMYNLSQAMGTGSLKLQDWMSIENANMATREFKQTLIDTAIEIGALEKDTEITAENMRETLKDGWVTRDVLTQTLAKYGNYTEDLYKIVGEGNEDIAGASDAMEEYAARYDDLMKQLYDAIDKYGKESEQFKKIVVDNALTMQTAMDLVDVQSNKVYNANLENIREQLTKTREAYGYESEQFRKEAEKSGFTLREAAKMVDEGVESFKKSEQSLGERSLRASQEAKTFKDAWEATIDGVSSAWLRFWQALFGNYEEARDLWTWLANDVLYEAFTAPAAAIAEAMEMAKEMGSFQEIFEGFQTLWSGPEDENGKRSGGIVAIFEAIKKAFINIFDFFENSKQLSFYIYAITVRFREWAESITLSEDKLLELQGTAEDIFTMLKAVGEIVFNVGWNILRIIKAILPKKETILGLIKDIFGETAKVEDQVGNITNKVTFVTNVIVFCITVIKRVLWNAMKVLPQIIALTITGIVSVLENFFNSDIFKIVSSIVIGVGAALLTAVGFILNQLSYLFSAIMNVVIAIIGVIDQFRNSEDKIQWLKDQFMSILSIFEPVKIIFDSIIQTFTVVSSVIGHLINGIADFISKIDVWRAALILLVLTLASNGIGIIAFLGNVISGIAGFVRNFVTTLNPIKFILQNFLSGIKDAIDGILSFIDVAKLEAIGHLIVMYAASVMMLAGAAIMLSTIDPEVFYKALNATVVLMGVLFAFALGVNKLMSYKIETITEDLKDNAGAITGTIKTVTETLKLGAGLFGIGFAIKAMAALVTSLGEVYDAVGRDPMAFFAIIAGVAALFIAVLGGVALIITTIKKNTKDNIKINSDVKNLDGFVLSIDLLGGTLNKLALALIGIGLALAIMDFVDPDRLMQSAIVLGGAAAVLMVLTTGITGITKLMMKGNTDEQNTALVTGMYNMGRNIEAIAKGVLIISASLALLSLLDPLALDGATRSILSVTLALMSLMATFTLLVRSINEEYTKDFKHELYLFGRGQGAAGGVSGGTIKEGVGGNDILKAGLAIQMLALSLVGVSAALIPLTLVDSDKMERAAFAVGGLMTGMAAVLAIFTYSLGTTDKVKSDDMIKIAGSMVIMAFALNLITTAIIPLAAAFVANQMLVTNLGISDVSPIESAMDTISAIIFAFGTYIVSLIAALGFYNKVVPTDLNTNLFVQIGKSLVLMAAGVSIISASIMALMGVQFLTIGKNAHSLQNATEAITVVLGSITIMVDTLMLSLSAVGKTGFDGSDKIIKQLGIMLVLMGAALTLVTACISTLALISTLPNAKVNESANAISIILLIMGLFGDLAVGLSALTNNNTERVIKSLGETFVLMSTGLLIISAGIALIAYSIGKNKTDTGAMIAGVSGLAGVFIELAGYLAIMAGWGKNYTDLDKKLLMIAASTEVMALAMVTIAYAIGQVLQYGADTWAGIGIFMTLIVIIGVYNAVMVALTEKIETGKVETLLLIAADFLIMASAIALIAPAIGELAAIQAQLKDGSIFLAVLQGLIIPMGAMILAVIALCEIAKGSGKYANLYDILAISILMASLAVAMGIMASAAAVLASVDTDKIAQVSASIVTTMVAFTICVGLLTYLSDKTGDSIQKLAISFLIFAASIWLVSEALDSMHTALANIVDDPNVQNFSTILANFIQEHPIAAAATALGVGIGANILLGIKDELDKQGINILEAPFEAVSDAAKKWWNDKLFGTKDANGNVLTVGWIPGIASGLKTALLKAANFISVELGGMTTAGAAEIAAGGTITSIGVAFATVAESIVAILSAGLVGWDVGRDLAVVFKGITTGEWEKDEYWSPIHNFFYDLGVKLGSAQSEGYRWALKNNPLDVSEFKEATINPNNKLENHVTRLAYDEATNLMNEYYSQTGELLSLDKLINKSSLKFWYGKEIAEREFDKVYNDVYQLYYDTYIKSREEVAQKEAEIEKQKNEESKARIVSVSKDIRKLLVESYNAQEEGQKHILTYEETIAALQEKYGTNAIKRTSQLQEAYRMAYDKAAMYVQSFTEVEKNTRQSVARVNAEIEKEVTDAEEARITRLKAELNYNKDITDERRDYILNEIKSYESKQDFLKNINALQGDISDTEDDILTADGARNLELSEQNKLLAEQSGILRYNNALQNGGLSGIIGEVTNSHNVISTISGWINTWKDKKIQDLSNAFKGVGSINTTTLGNVFNMIKGGGTYESLSDRIKRALGISDTGTTLDIFKQLGGGILDFSQIANFDVNDVQGSIKKIIKGFDTSAEGKNLFEEIFKMDASNFSVDAFLDKLTAGLNYEDIIKKLGGEDVAGAYEDADWSKVTNMFEDEFNNIGLNSADAFSTAFGNGLTTGIDKIKSPIEQIGETIVSIIQPAADKLNQILQEKADAAAQAYTTAFEAAKEVWDKENPGEDTTLIGRSVDEMNSTVKSAADSAVMIGVYKKNYEYWKDRAKKLGSTILNTDGTYKEGVTDKQKESYEKAKAEADRYKQLLDSEKENSKAIKEEIRKDAERIMYINNPDKLEEAISDAEEKRDNIYQSMVDGTFEAGTDIVDELQKANDNLNELITLREEIGADLVANNPDDEANAIHEGFDFNSKYAKAAYNALTKENNRITERLREIQNEMNYLAEFDDDISKQRYQELQDEARQLKIQREANRDLKNSMSTYELDSITLEELNKEIEEIENALKTGSYLMNDDGTFSGENLYHRLLELRTKRDNMQQRKDYLDSLTENGIEEGQLETKTDIGYNTLALSDNTTALNNLSNSLNNFGLSEEEIKKKADEALASGVGNVPTTEDELNKYLTDNGYKSMSDINEQTAKAQADYQKQMEEAEKNAEDMAKQAMTTTGNKLAGGMSKEMLLTGGVQSTSETTVSDIVIISNDVAAIRVASENILATIVGWKAEMGAHNAAVLTGLSNIQNRGVPIANRMSFMNEVSEAVDVNLGNKVTRRARGN